MLLLRTSDQLGNQMFAYAAVKTIALDKGFEFRLIKKSMDGELSNDRDGVYGNTIDSIFAPVREDLLTEPEAGITTTIEGMKQFREVTDTESVSAVCAESFSVSDDTLMEGHYIASGYFMHRLDEVRRWFAFPEKVLTETEEKLAAIRSEHPGSLLVSVHFRVGTDYRTGGYLLERTYFKRAAGKMSELAEKEGKKVIFLLFYDKKEETVSEFERMFPCVDMRGSLVYDLCGISRCDAHIVCNSSFSMMGALLDSKEGIVVCPSSFPIPDGFLPADCYPPQWIKIEAVHDKEAYREYQRFMKRYLWKQKIKKLLGVNRNGLFTFI